MVAGADLVEAVVAVGEHPGEDVEPAGRALRVGLGAHVVGQRQLLDQRHQVGTVALEHGAVAQVDPLEGEALDLLLDGRVDVGQEAAAQRPGEVAEAQVDAGRLDRLGPDPVVARADPFGLDRLAQRLRGQDAVGSAAARCSGAPAAAAASPRSSPEIMRRASATPRYGVSANSASSGKNRRAWSRLRWRARGARAARRCRRQPPRRSPAAAGAPPSGDRRPARRQRDELWTAPLVAVVDAAARRAAPRPAADLRLGRLGGEQAEQRGERGTAPRSPTRPVSAGREHVGAEPLDGVVVGGEEAGILALEVRVEVALGDPGAPADRRRPWCPRSRSPSRHAASAANSRSRWFCATNSRERPWRPRGSRSIGAEVCQR